MRRPEDTGSPAGLEGRIRRRVADLLERAAPIFEQGGTRVPEPALRFDLRGQAAGQAAWRQRGRPELRFNLQIARSDPAGFLEQTVAHEVAHLITFTCFGRTAPHGREWRAVMRHLGIADPQRCHDYAIDETQVRRQRRWRYRCACRSHDLSTTRHNRLQAGRASYQCRHCGTSLRFDPHRQREGGPPGD